MQRFKTFRSARILLGGIEVNEMNSSPREQGFVAVRLEEER